MKAEKEIKELEKNRRLSARAIPLHVGFLVMAVVALWTLGRFFTIPLGIRIIVLGITAFTLIGDIHNYFYCNRRLRTLKHGHDA
jgi:hypothetical protein